MNESTTPTPETDKEIRPQWPISAILHARKLERERNAARKERDFAKEAIHDRVMALCGSGAFVQMYQQACRDRDALAKQVRQLREKLTEIVSFDERHKGWFSPAFVESITALLSSPPPPNPLAKVLGECVETVQWVYDNLPAPGTNEIVFEGQRKEAITPEILDDALGRLASALTSARQALGKEQG